MNNPYLQNLKKDVKAILFQKKTLTIAGFSALTIGTMTYMLNTLGNVNYIPESMVCFRPPEINSDKNAYKLACDSSQRVKIMLTPLYEYWASRDIDFASKVAKNGYMRSFDNNLNYTRNISFLALVLGLWGAGCFGWVIKLDKDAKPLFYRYKQALMNNLEIDSEAATKHHQSVIMQDFAIQPTILDIKKAQLEIAKLEKEIAENNLSALENNVKIDGIKNGDVKIMSVDLKQELPKFKGVEWFNWEWFRTKSSEEDIPHIRVVASTGSGKSTFISWLMQEILQGDKTVYTPKADKNKFLWGKLEVNGIPENWAVIKSGLDKIVSLRSERNKLIYEDPDNANFEILNVLFDESKDTREGMGTYFQDVLRASTDASQLTPKKLKEAKALGISFYEDSIKTTLRQARAAKIRLILTAISKYVGAWGLQGESDLVECFLTVFMGVHAHDEIEKYIYAKPSLKEEEKEEICSFMKKQGKRAAFIESNFGNFLAVIPEIDFKKIQSGKE